MSDRTVPTDMDRRALMKLPLTTRRIVLKAFADVEVLTTALAAEKQACERLAEVLDAVRLADAGAACREIGRTAPLDGDWLAWAHGDTP